MVLSNNIVLSLSGINKTFTQGNNKLHVLQDTNLEVKKGEIIALIGPSGSGKSTLLYIAGLLDKADNGSISILGKNCNKLNDSAKTKIRLNNIGFVYQQHNLFSDFTAVENIMLPMLINGVGKDDAYKLSLEKLEMIGLKHRASHKPSELSGGEQQRIAIARSLANNPQILLADEPTGNLDPYNSDNVFNMLLNLVKEKEMTAIIATHNPVLASKMDRQLALVSGKLYDIHKTEDISILKTTNAGNTILKSFR